MAQDVKLTMDGTLLNWLKNVGDAVKSGDIIAEFEADKATVEVEAPADGILTSQSANVGDELSEGAVIAQIEVGGAGAATPAASAPTEQSRTPVATAAAPQVAADTVAVPPSNGAAADSAATMSDGRLRVSPLARNIAREKGIDLKQVQGSGPDGRITRADVERTQEEGYQPLTTPGQTGAADLAPAEIDLGRAAKPSRQGDVSPATIGKPTYGKLPEASADVEISDLSRMRRAIADNTILSKQMVPHFYVTMDIDVEPMLALRAQLNAGLEGEGIKISVNDLVVKATALTLRRFPNLNTHYFGDKMVHYKHINIGIAVALPNNGLINVVSQDADSRSLSAMARQHKEMFDRAREGKIKPDDIRGATFTVSNLGPYDVEQFSAIINPPEAGILAVSSARKVPVVKADGSVGVGNRMKVTISIDHRVSDGAEGAQFMQYFRGLLENPMRLLV